MVAPNSAKAYKEEEDSGRLVRSRQIVLNALYTLKSANNKILSNFLGLPINQITGRVTELREKFHYIELEKDAVCPFSKTGKITSYWKCTPLGVENAEIMKDPRVDMLEFRPYKRIERQGGDFFEFWVCSSVNIKKSHHVGLDLDYSGKEKWDCACQDFQFKYPLNNDYHCKHITRSRNKLVADGVLE